jgi:hypothetical protein
MQNSERVRAIHRSPAPGPVSSAPGVIFGVGRGCFSGTWSRSETCSGAPAQIPTCAANCVGPEDGAVRGAHGAEDALRSVAAIAERNVEWVSAEWVQCRCCPRGGAARTMPLCAGACFI